MEHRCSNCGHMLYEVQPGAYEHYTRFYMPAHMPYTTIRCYAYASVHVNGEMQECRCCKPEFRPR